MRTALLLPLLALLAACGKTGNGEGELPTIDVEANFEVDSLDELSGKLRVVSVCRPEFTDSSMLTSYTLGGVVDNRLYIKENGYTRNKSWICTFDYPSGRLIRAFNRYGGGPEEFDKGYFGAFRQAGAGEWAVVNSMLTSDKILIYNTEGDCLQVVKTDTIGSTIGATSTGWVAFNVPISFEGDTHVIREKEITFYTPDWKPDGSITLKSRRWKPVEIQQGDALFNMRGSLYINDLDTIYRIDAVEKKLEPVLALNMGKYGYDWGAVETRDELNQAMESHVFPLYPVFNSRYAFVQYHLGNSNGVVRYDVYDIIENRLVFRRSLPASEYSSFNSGIPLEIDGYTYMAWPNAYTNSENFFFLISSDQAAEAAGDDNVNPIIVEVEIK